MRETGRDESQSVPSPEKLFKTRDLELPIFEGTLPSCSPHSAGYTRPSVHPYFPVPNASLAISNVFSGVHLKDVVPPCLYIGPRTFFFIAENLSGSNRHPPRMATHLVEIVSQRGNRIDLLSRGIAQVSLSYPSRGGIPYRTSSLHARCVCVFFPLPARKQAEIKNLVAPPSPGTIPPTCSSLVVFRRLLRKSSLRARSAPRLILLSHALRF